MNGNGPALPRLARRNTRRAPAIATALAALAMPLSAGAQEPGPPTGEPNISVAPQTGMEAPQSGETGIPLAPKGWVPDATTPSPTTKSPAEGSSTRPPIQGDGAPAATSQSSGLVGERPPLDALRSRPLFAADRRPPPILLAQEPEPTAPPTPAPEAQPVVPSAVGKPVPPEWTLVGVMRGAPASGQPTEAMALLRDVSTGEVFMLKGGGEQAGWRLAEVKRFSIILQQADETVEIGLADDDGSTPDGGRLPSAAPATPAAPTMDNPTAPGKPNP